MEAHEDTAVSGFQTISQKPAEGLINCFAYFGKDIMRRYLLILSLAYMTVCGCTHQVLVYSPDDKPVSGSASRPTGSFSPLSEIVKDRAEVRLVFVHGVGDHCPGYAIGDDEHHQGADWLAPDTLNRLHLQPVPNTQHSIDVFAGEMGVGGPADDQNIRMAVLTRDYLTKLPGEDATPVSVHATEITWSTMTQWIKNKLLAYDATGVSYISALDSLGNGVDPCVNEHKVLESGTFAAPPRLAVNASIKWGLLDRALSDALIYTGSYGEGMERGMAAALCRVVKGSQVEGNACRWPSSDIVASDNSHYIFVTHSLGSRILYDTFLGLLKEPHARNPFAESYLSEATPAIKNIVSRTPVIYMMANQITLLGLTRIPPDTHFDAPPQSYTQPESTYGPMSDIAESLLADTKKLETVNQESDPLLLLAQERAKIRGEQNQQQPANGETNDSNLQVITFNDTNDLLTWHLPSWYSSSANDGKINAVDVFVQNSSPILGLTENPLNAHSDYFKNKEVWEAILCGAKNGHVLNCL